MAIAAEEIKLVRKARLVEVPEAVDHSQEELAKAANQLGYSALMSDLTRRGYKRDVALQMNAIISILSKNKIEPIDNVAVEKYKKHERTRKNRSSRDGFASWDWQVSRIPEWYDPIPEFAVSRMVEVHQLLTTQGIEPIFMVEALRQNSKKADPFLVVGTKRMMDSAMYVYLDVWEEPIFEGRRTV